MIHHLELELDFSFRSFGMSCHSKDYKMAWMINKQTQLELEYDFDLSVETKKGKSAHSIYTCSIEEGRIHISLINNRSKSGYLLPELGQMDFIIKIEGAEDEECKELLAAIKSMPQVLYTMEFDPEQLKSGSNLIY